MRRYLAALAGATLAAGAVFGSPGTARAVEIEYWQYFFQGRVTAIDALIEQFEAENPDITVRHTHFPYADYRTKVAAAIPAGEGPDVVQLFYGWLDDYIKADLLQPLPTDMFPAFFAVSRSSGWCTHVIEEQLAEAHPKDVQVRRPRMRCAVVL